VSNRLGTNDVPYDASRLNTVNISLAQSSGSNNAITALTGDVTATGPGSVPATLATVNANVGTWGSSSQISQVTVNAKGLVTAAANVSIDPTIFDTHNDGRYLKLDASNDPLTGALDIEVDDANALRVMTEPNPSYTFPSTAILDAFNRSEGPPLSANWSNPNGLDGLFADGAACSTPLENSATAYAVWLPLDELTECEVYATTVNTSSTVANVYLFARVQDPNNPTQNSYALHAFYDQASPGDSYLEFILYVDGTPANDQILLDWHLGDSFGLLVEDNGADVILTAYRNGVQEHTLTDSTAQGFSVGYIGIGLSGDDSDPAAYNALDNFGGGTPTSSFTSETVFNVDSITKVTSGYRLEATVLGGLSPLIVTSRTLNTNLNADLLDGLHASAFALDGAPPAAHVLDGALHTVSGRTANQVLQATGAATFGWSTNTLAISGNSTINGSLVEVNASQSHEVAAMGDSLTSEGTWVAQLITLIGAGWHAANHGATGQTTTAMAARFTSDIITPGGVEYVVIFGGINDVAADVSAATIEANLQAMYTAAHNASIKVIAVTITPFKGSASWSAPRQAVLDAVNTWILATAINVDYKIDAYTALEDPGVSDTLLAANDSGDHIHLSTVGYQLVGTTIYGGSTFTPKASFVNLFVSGTNIYLDQSLRASDPVAFGSVAANTATIGALTTTGAIGVNLTNTGMIYSRFTGDSADRYRFGGGGAGGFLIQSLDAVTPRTLQVVSSGGVAKAAIDFETGNTTIAGTTLLQGVTTITAGNSTVITGGLIFTQTKISTAAGVYKFLDLTGTIDLPSNALGNQDFYLVNGLIQTAADATVYSNANLRSFYLSPRHNGSGTLGTTVGGFVDIFNLGAGQINTAFGYYSLIRNAGTGKIVIVRNFSASNMTNTGGGVTADTQYGYYCESLTTGTANYAFYSAGLGLNRFGDQLSIVGGADRSQLIVTGFTTQTATVAQLLRNDGNTNAVATVLTIGANSTGTAAAGFGARQLFTLESSTTADQSAAALDVLWTDSTHATKTSAFDVSTTGPGKCRAWGYNGIDGTARTIIVNGTGDVTEGITVQYVASEVTGTECFGGVVYLEPSDSFAINTDGTNVLTLTCAADGSVTIARSAGTETYKFQAWMVWV